MKSSNLTNDPGYRTATALAAAILLVLASVPALAGPHGHRGHGKHGPPPFARILERHADRLGLDEATQAEIREVAEAAREEGRGYRERLHSKHDTMRELLDAAEPDEGAIMTLADEIGVIEIEAQKHRLRTMLKIRSRLTPEQREKLVELHEEMREKRREKREKRREHREKKGDGPDTP